LHFFGKQTTSFGKTLGNCFNSAFLPIVTLRIFSIILRGVSVSYPVLDSLSGGSARAKCINHSFTATSIKYICLGKADERNCFYL